MTSLLLLTLTAQTLDQPVRAVTDPGIVTTRQSITPAGVPSIFQGRVYGVAFGDSPSEVWVLNATQLYRLNWRENKVATRFAHGGSLPGLQGLVFDRATKTAYATTRTGNNGPVKLFNASGDTLANNIGTINTGALAVANNVALVPLIANNKLAIVDLASNKLTGTIDTPIAPFGAALNAKATIAYVTNWGGRPPKPGDLTAPTGYAANADRVVVDDRGVASTGAVLRLDLATRKITHSIPVELHPTALVLDEPRARLYVANSNKDSVSVIDTNTNRVLQTIAIQPFAQRVNGIAPVALAISADGAKLYAACGGINAVAVISTATAKLEGLIPTAWYPNSLSLSPDGKHLAIGALLGPGSGWRDAPAKRFVHSYRGSVHVVDLPEAAQLASFTTAVAENNHLPLAGSAVAASGPADRRPRAIPYRSGDPSLIEHIVYIVKENRTYDQVLGALPHANGDASLVMFGRDVTPNQHRLSEEYVTLDNFYATGGNSADGHQWLTQANETSYALWPGYHGRSYPFDGSDPIAYASGGFIWDYAVKRGKSVKIYGEFAGVNREGTADDRLKLLREWKDGADFSTRWNFKAPMASVDKLMAHHFPPYDLSVPDVARAQIFLKDLAQWERSGGAMPHLTILQLPSDHTYGTSPRRSTPKAMVADNDLALGLIVEGISKSKFWPKTAIFVVEDDAQNGVDHVDGHRTVALAISPYTKRGSVDSTFYSHQSMLKTMELILGLPTMSLFDLIANDLRASFTDTPDLRPYAALTPQQDLLETNPAVSALRGAERQAALASARMKWSVPDAAPSDRLNRILWHSTRGWNTPFPGVRQAVFAPLSLEVDDDDR